MLKLIDIILEKVIKEVKRMNKDERRLLFYLVIINLTMVFMLFGLWHQSQIIKTYKEADYRLGLRLDEVHNELEIVKILISGEKEKSTKLEIAEALEEYFKTKKRGK